MNIEALNQLIERLQRIAVKNHDEFRYKIEITPRRVGGTDYRFICQENAEGHAFLIGTGYTIDLAVADANNSVLGACEDWGYTP